MPEPIWTQTYEVNTLVLNTEKRLGLVGLLGLLQDVAWIHARHLGHGYDSMIEKQLIWVLTRQSVTMRAWPGWGDTIAIRTWVRPVSGPVAHRDYQVLSGETVIGEGTASWLTLDVRSRRPARLSVGEDALACRREGCLADEPPKLEIAAEAETIASLRVKNGDLDVNGHVNNTRYAQWILDAVPLETQATHRLTGYQVNFLAETRVGDQVEIRKAAALPAGGAQFQGFRPADGKTVFVARLMAEPSESSLRGA